MVFSSLIFLCFFLPFVFILYFLCPQKYRNYILAFASLIFYAWCGIPNTLLLFGVVIFNYLIGILLGKLKSNRKQILFVGICINLTILFIFKYFNFFIGNINLFFDVSINVAEIVLPVGISFYIFQSISYIVDVYRQYKDPSSNTNEIYYQKNFIDMFLYITFFPQLIAGPIVRYHDIAEQLKCRTCNEDKIAIGLSRFICGLSKKVIFADFLGKIADDIFHLDLANLSTPTAWLGILCYALQIFFDFSGYSDMAIGIGKIFGFDFLENFNFPYISKSITEFWRRWHMSLSGWFRDYVYIPLGGNRHGNVYVNLAVVFILTGIWHGAHWGYIIWGVWHGFFILFERFCKNSTKINITIPSVFRWLYTMFIVLIGWVFFRADSIFTAIEYIKVMLSIRKPDFVLYDITYYLNSRNIFILILAAILAILPIRQILKERITETVYRNIAHIFSIVLLLICFIMIVNSTYSPFIYFQF